MAINFNGNNVSHITQNGKYVTLLDYDKKTVWAEKVGTYTTGALPSGTKSLECIRNTSKDPGASIGKLSDGAVLYYGDTLSFTGKTTNNHDARIANSPVTVEGNSNLVDSNREQTFNGVNLSGISALKDVTITCSTGVSSVKIEYLNQRRVATTSTSTTVKELIDAVNRPTTWTATAKSGYVLPITTGTFVGGYPDNITYTAGAEPYSWKPVIADLFIKKFGNLNFTKTDEFNPWFIIGGMARYEKVRVSGTYKVTFNQTNEEALTGSFSNVVLASNETTETTICSDGQMTDKGGYAAFTATMKRNPRLVTTVTFEEPYSDAISIKNVQIVITSVEVYVPFYCDDAFEINQEEYGFVLYNTGLKPYSIYKVGNNTEYYILHEARYLNVCGNCDWSSESYDSYGSFKNLGTVKECYDLDSIDATVIGSASDGQQNVNQYSLGFAISDSTTGYMVSTMTWVQNII